MKNINPNQTTSLSQVQAIKAHLLKGKKITPLDALERYGSMRLGARIFDLQSHPHHLKIEKTMILTKSGKRVAQYKLVK